MRRKEVRVVALVTAGATASGLRVGDCILSANGVCVKSLDAFVAAANAVSKTLKVKFQRPPRLKGSGWVGRLFCLMQQQVSFTVTKHVQDTGHRIAYFADRDPEWIDLDANSDNALAEHFGEQPVPAGEHYQRVSIALVDTGGAMFRAGAIPGLCSLLPESNDIVIELVRERAGVAARFREKCSLSQKNPLLQSENMMALTSSDSGRQICLEFCSVHACEVFCALVRGRMFPVHRVATLRPSSPVPATNLNRV